MNRNRTRLSILLGVFALAATAGCTKTAQTAPPIFAVPVTVAKVTQKTVPIDLTAIGSADANSSVSIKAQVNAVLDEVHIKEGQFVKKGQLLFTLDARAVSGSPRAGAGESRARIRLRKNWTTSRRTATRSFIRPAWRRKSSSTR